MARKKTESRPAVGWIEASNIVKDAVMPAIQVAWSLDNLIELIEGCDANGDGEVAIHMLAKLREVANIHKGNLLRFRAMTEPEK